MYVDQIMLEYRDMGAHRGPCTQDEPGVELHTKGRTVTDDGDWYSAEKHAWAASAEERAMDARGPAMRGMRQAPRTLLGGPALQRAHRVIRDDLPHIIPTR